MRKFLLIIVYFFYIIATAYRCFFSLDTLPVQRWDEKTNIDVVSAFISGSFPLLTIEGKPFFEKPPLWYFITSAAGAISGNLPLTARLVSAISGFLLIILTTYLAWRWWGTAASIICWSILLSTQHLFISNPGGIFSTHTFRSADLDSLFILFFMVSFAIGFIIPEPKSRGIITGIFSGLAALTKGPSGLLPLLLLSGRSLPIAFAMSFLVLFPWYSYMIIVFGWPFISTHFFYHVVQRSFYAIEGHMQPWWYYISILTNRAFFFSWEMVVISIVWIFTRKMYKSDRHVRAVLLMFSYCFILPTMMQTRLAWYILPAYPFAALIVAASTADIIRALKSVYISNSR